MKICNIQGLSLHDGPGIRTSIFMAGCPLHCSWCHNPETQSVAPVLVFEEKSCIGCRLCEVCTTGVHSFSPRAIDRKRCSACGECVGACPTRALSLSVSTLTLEGFLSVVEKQKRTVGKDGGITFTGGEPLVQGEELLAFANATDIHVALETCGYADAELFARVIERVDYVMYDLKLADDDAHIKYTGVSNKQILENLRILKESGKPHVFRTPLVPGITDTSENLDAIKKLVGDDEWETLPYNRLTPSKYERIGREYTLDCK